jgi:hypothetical protein
MYRPGSADKMVELEPRRPGDPSKLSEVQMNRFDWTFSGSAEVVTGVLLVLAIVAAAFA